MADETETQRQVRTKRREARASATAGQILDFTQEVFGDDIHAKRVSSIADATTGLMRAASLGITAMGCGLSAVIGIDPDYAAKQIDRMLGNSGLDLGELFISWTLWMVGDRKAITVAMDWTEFDRDAHATLSLNMVTDHGRAMPLLWRTISTKDPAVTRPEVEKAVLRQLRSLVDEDVDVTVLGDRWFGNQELYELCYELGIDFIFRFRSIISVEDRHGVTKSAKEWFGKHRRTRSLRDVRVTGSKCWVGQVVLTHDKGMAEPWCLVTSLMEEPAKDVVTTYGRRFTIEECFRDIKDDRTGFGLKEVRMKRTDRRDRLLFVAALALALTTMLGAASELCGFDRKFSSKARLKRGRQISLVRQGLFWFQALPARHEDDMRTMMKAFGQVIREQPHASEILGLNK